MIYGESAGKSSRWCHTSLCEERHQYSLWLPRCIYRIWTNPWDRIYRSTERSSATSFPKSHRTVPERHPAKQLSPTVCASCTSIQPDDQTHLESHRLRFVFRPASVPASLQRISSNQPPTKLQLPCHRRHLPPKQLHQSQRQRRRQSILARPRHLSHQPRRRRRPHSPPKQQQLHRRHLRARRLANPRPPKRDRHPRPLRRLPPRHRPNPQ